MCDRVSMSNIGNAPGDLFLQTITTIVTTTAVIPTTTNQPTNQPTATTTTTTTKKKRYRCFHSLFLWLFSTLSCLFFRCLLFRFFCFSRPGFRFARSVFMNHQSKLAVEFKAETTFHFRVRLQNNMH